MAVRWRCPGCEGERVETDPFGLERVVCGECGRELAREEALCVVCDAPGALKARDSVHVQCRTCGSAQMIFADILVAAR
ncbi:MAG: hypothetical protein ACRD2J_15630 [Thermoanaerobaculia bacterium]